jgi:hypothetical protein
LPVNCGQSIRRIVLVAGGVAVNDLLQTVADRVISVGEGFASGVVGSGEPGEMVRARVADDVKVKQVSILIATGEDIMVEQGQMAHEQGLWYTYTTTADCPPGPAKVVVTGLDLPGHTGNLRGGARVCQTGD